MLSRFPLFRVFIAYTIGVLLAGYHFVPSSFFFYGLAVFALCTFIILWAIFNKNYRFSQLLFGVIILSFLLAGVLNTQSREVIFTPNNTDNNYGRNYIKVKLQEQPIEKENSFKAVALVLIQKPVGKLSGQKLLMYFQKDRSVEKLLPGDELILSTNIQAISPPKNPHEFDYRGYLSLLRIHNQTYVKTQNWKLHKPGGWSLRKTAVIVQKKLTRVIDQLGFPDNETNVLKALLTGYRFALSDELTATYASAGAMHVLAVSGLHVGILLLLLNFISKPLEKLKYGKIWRGIFLIFGIWSYAFITGLSPSVTRAATMFTFVTWGMLNRKNIGIYSTLLASAFLLLIYQPNLIFQVGFQLSYAAVLGIVYWQPKFYHLIKKPKYWLVDKAWAITCVSVAAQLATFPLGIYYFHQFPLLFLISNLIVIPAAWGIMILGLPVLGLGLLGLFIFPLNWLLYNLVHFMNLSVKWVEGFPHSLVSELSILRWELVVFYLIILLFFKGFYNNKARHILASLVLFLGLTSFAIYENHQLKTSSGFVIFSTGKNLVIEFRQGKIAIIIGDSSLIYNPSKMQFHLLHHLWSQNLQETTLVSLKNIHFKNEFLIAQSQFIKFNDQSFLLVSDVLDSVYAEVFEPDFVIISKNTPVFKTNARVILGAGVSLKNANRWKEKYRERVFDLKEKAFVYKGRQ